MCRHSKSTRLTFFVLRQRFARSLHEVGLRRFDAVNIIGFNSPGLPVLSVGPHCSCLMVGTMLFPQSGSLPIWGPSLLVECPLESTRQARLLLASTSLATEGQWYVVPCALLGELACSNRCWRA